MNVLKQIQPVKRIRVDLDATFSNLNVGNAIEFEVGKGITEGNIRTKASRFNKKNNVDLRVSVSSDTGMITVIRNAHRLLIAILI